MIICTAFNSAFREVGSMCVESMFFYYDTHHDIPFTWEVIHDNYARHPSWWKINLIRRLLPDQDYVLWIDADALVIGTDDFRNIIKPHTLNISEDVNGVNAGVMAWRNCLESFDALNRMESLYDRFREHEWREQAALMTFIKELDVFYQPKTIWNAYPNFLPDVTEDTMIVHYPGTENNLRAELMREFKVEAAFA